jgi:TonB family protein
MMKKKTENKFAIVKQLAVLPLLAILVMGLANKEVKTEVIQPPVKAKITAVSVVEKETKVSGKVIDEKGKPLAGVAVLVKGTTTGTITDDKGNFKLLIDDKAETLIFSLNGFERVETPAGHGETQVIELELKAEKNAKPGEIVVVGYGTQKAESTSGGGYSISGGMNGTMQKGSENFTITPSSQNGLTIKSGGDPKNHPLFVVDGTEVKSIENLNPEEIEKIEVLKDKSATAVYGDKGKNGVILISTKKNDIPVQVKTTGKTKSGESLFYIVDEMPEYPGGDLALRTKIAHDIKYPVIAQENGIQGKVYVSFVVAKDGKVTEPVITRGVDPALDKEALRVVSNLEKWTPGKIDGEPVNVSYTIPITFALQGPTAEQSPAVSGQFNKQAIYDLRRKIAQSIKYPVIAQENNQQGVVDIWAFIAKDGTISNISEKRLEGKIINIDEVVVTALKSEKAVTSEKSNDLALLVKESKRVIGQLSPLKIPELAGETVSFRIRFLLE